jgi:hypothetical protein
MSLFEKFALCSNSDAFWWRFPGATFRKTPPVAAGGVSVFIAPFTFLQTRGIAPRTHIISGLKLSLSRLPTGSGSLMPLAGAAIPGDGLPRHCAVGLHVVMKESCSYEDSCVLERHCCDTTGSATPSPP